MNSVKRIFASVVFVMGTGLFAQHSEFEKFGCFEDTETPDTLVCRRSGSFDSEDETTDYKVETITFKNAMSNDKLVERKLYLEWKVLQKVEPATLITGINSTHIEKICDIVASHFFVKPHSMECVDDTCLRSSFSNGECVLSVFEDTVLKVSIDFSKGWEGSNKDSLRLISNIACRIYCDSECTWSCFFSDIVTINKDTISKDAQKALLLDVSRFVNKYLGTISSETE